MSSPGLLLSLITPAPTKTNDQHTGLYKLYQFPRMCDQHKSGTLTTLVVPVQTDHSGCTCPISWEDWSMMLTPMPITLKNVMILMVMIVMMKWLGCPIRSRRAIDSGWRSKGDQSKETHTTFPRNRWILIYNNWKELTTLAAWYQLATMENKWQHQQHKQQQQWEEDHINAS